MIRKSGVLVLMLVFASPLVLPSHNCSASDAVFSVHPKNHRCFLYQGKPMKILTSAEHYGAVMNGEFDYDVYLKEMQRTGQNATRVFTFYRELWGHNVRNTLATSKETPETTVMPWKRASGRGKGPDGLDKFDLDRWNPAYFARLKDYVQKCTEHGVICEIVLFCNPYLEKQYAWFPCNKTGNINGVGNDLDDRQQFMTLESPTVVAFQERFVRKVVKELNEFDNVYYEICNEPTFPKEWTRRGELWHAHVADTIRQVEKNLPNQHLIAANLPNNEAIANNPDIDILNYHYPPGARTWQRMRQRDRYRKPLVYDENYTGVVGKNPVERYAVNRSEAWVTILSGCGGFNSLDWTFTAADETGSGKVPLLDGRKIDGRPLREWLDIFRQLLGQYDVARLVPAVGVLPDRISGYGYAATTDGKGKYILYFVDERLFRSEPCKTQPFAVTLELPTGQYAVRTFEPRSGNTTAVAAINSTGTASLKIPPFREDVAILLERGRQ